MLVLLSLTILKIIVGEACTERYPAIAHMSQNLRVRCDTEGHLKCLATQDTNLSACLFSHHMNTCLPPTAARWGLIVWIGTKFFLILNQNMLPANLLHWSYFCPFEVTLHANSSSAWYLSCCFLQPPLTDLQVNAPHHFPLSIFLWILKRCLFN